MSSRLSSLVTRIGSHSAIRFLVVGGVSIGIDTGLLYVLHGVLGIWLPVATATAYLLSIGFNFALNRLWTFGAVGAVHWHALRYALLVAANLTATVVLVQALTWAGLPYLAAKLLTAAVLAVSNYFISRSWVYA